jgi:hypothetical protein
MRIENFQHAKVFRYETESGFGIETVYNVVPVFNMDEKSVDWYNLAFSPLIKFDSLRVPQQKMQMYRFSEGIADFNLIETTQGWVNYANTIYIDSSVSSTFATLPSPPDFYVGTFALDQVQLACQCLQRHEKRIVDHNCGHSLLMAGHEYLVSRDEQERTEASAKTHVTHLEFLTLSRDHSNPNLFSTALKQLRKFGWRTWFTISQLSGERSNSWPGFTLWRHLCPLSAITSGHVN